MTVGPSVKPCRLISIATIRCQATLASEESILPATTLRVRALATSKRNSEGACRASAASSQARRRSSRPVRAQRRAQAPRRRSSRGRPSKAALFKFFAAFADDRNGIDRASNPTANLGQVGQDAV